MAIVWIVLGCISIAYGIVLMCALTSPLMPVWLVICIIAAAIGIQLLEGKWPDFPVWAKRAIQFFGIAVMLFAIYQVLGGTYFFPIWYLIGAILLALGVAMHTGAWEALRLWQRLCIEVVLGLSALGIVGLSAFVLSASVAPAPEGLETIIVLGTEVEPDGRPSALLNNRINAAFDYLLSNPSTKAIGSGAKGATEPMSEGKCIADELENLGIASERVIAEERAVDTKENIAYSKELLSDTTKPIGVVTNDFHLWRSVQLARLQGLEAYGISAPSIPWLLPHNVLREDLAIIKFLIKG